jgi:hypothetical protein
MNRTLLLLISVSLIVLQMSCTYVEQEIESPDFRVEVGYTPMADNTTEVFSMRKNSPPNEQRVLCIDRDDSVGVKLLDDSILVVTDINDGNYPSLLVNLQDEDTPTLFFSVGKGMLHRDTTRLSTIQIGDSVAATFQKNSRSDVYFVTARYDSYPYAVGTVVITLLGASGVEIVDWSGDFLVFDCIWLRQPSRQRFSVNLADRSLNPEDFSIIESEPSP